MLTDDIRGGVLMIPMTCFVEVEYDVWCRWLDETFRDHSRYPIAWIKDSETDIG